MTPHQYVRSNGTGQYVPCSGCHIVVAIFWKMATTHDTLYAEMIAQHAKTTQ